METCPVCMGKGKIQPSILFTDQVAEACAHMSDQHGRGLKLHLHPYVYAYVSKGWILSLKSKWRRRYGVRVVENQALGMLEMRFLDAKGNIIAHQQSEAPKPAEQPKKVEQPKPVEQPKKVEQPKPVEQPNKVDQPKPVEQPKEVEQPKPVEQPKNVEQPKKEVKPKKAKPTKQTKVEAKQVEQLEQEVKPQSKKHTRKAAKPKEAPVEPAEKSQAEIKAPAVVKRRAKAKKKAEQQVQTNNEENK